MAAELHFSQGDIGASLAKFDATDKHFHVRGLYPSHHLVKLSEGKLRHIRSSSDEVVSESLKVTKLHCSNVPCILDELSQGCLPRVWRRLQLPALSAPMQTQPQNLGKH